VPTYRLFFFAGKHIVDHMIVDKPDDQAAFDAAWSLGSRLDIEIWELGRIIVRLPGMRRADNSELV
jgi:hypothetical protein